MRSANDMILKGCARRESTHNSPSPCAAGTLAAAARGGTDCPAGGCALGVRGLPFVWAKPAHASQGQVNKIQANAYLNIESNLRSAPVAASTLSGKRRHGADSARGAGRYFDSYGEAAPRRGVYGCKTLR